MSRHSSALRRIVGIGLVAAVIGAGVPAIVSTRSWCRRRPRRRPQVSRAATTPSRVTTRKRRRTNRTGTAATSAPTSPTTTGVTARATTPTTGRTSTTRPMTTTAGSRTRTAAASTSASPTTTRTPAAIPATTVAHHRPKASRGQTRPPMRPAPRARFRLSSGHSRRNRIRLTGTSRGAFRRDPRTGGCRSVSTRVRWSTTATPSTPVRIPLRISSVTIWSPTPRRRDARLLRPRSQHPTPDRRHRRESLSRHPGREQLAPGPDVLRVRRQQCGPASRPRVPADADRAGERGLRNPAAAHRRGMGPKVRIPPSIGGSARRRSEPAADRGQRSTVTARNARCPIAAGNARHPSAAGGAADLGRATDAPTGSHDRLPAAARASEHGTADRCSGRTDESPCTCACHDGAAASDRRAGRARIFDAAAGSGRRTDGGRPARRTAPRAVPPRDRSHHDPGPSGRPCRR